MAFSRVERWANRLDAVEYDINKYHRWATGEIVLLNPDTIQKFEYAVTKILIEPDTETDLCQG